MDFIIKSFSSKKPITKFKYNFIIIVIDWLTKDIKFIPFIKWVDTQDLAYMFLKWIISKYNFLEKIISN